MPALASNKRLKRTITNQVLFTRLAKTFGRKVAWVTSGSPVEILLAAGIVPFYPENHAALCAARGVGADLASVAEEARYSRDLCSYFRIDLGSVISGRTPMGRLTPPDLMLATNNICGTVQNWFRITADRFGVPFLFLDTPFSDEPVTDGDVAYVREQIVALAHEAARIAGRRFSESRLAAVTGRSLAALTLWNEFLRTAAARPAPITCFDAFVHMAPIVSMRGTRRAVRYYRHLLAEARDRTRAGIAAVSPERARVVWDNIAIWPAHRELKRLFRDAGVALVADTYTSAWSTSHLDAVDPLTGLARAYDDIILNHGAPHRVDVLVRLIRDFNAGGFILHSNRSCKRYSLGQMVVKQAVTERTGVPGLIIEADMGDARCVSMEALKARLLPFFEQLT